MQKLVAMRGKIAGKCTIYFKSGRNTVNNGMKNPRKHKTFRDFGARGLTELFEECRNISSLRVVTGDIYVEWLEKRENASEKLKKYMLLFYPIDLQCIFFQIFIISLLVPAILRIADC